MSNSISELNLNHRLEILYIGSNEFIELPILHENITFLNCENNKISNVTNLPRQLKTLRCSYNPIIEIILPEQLTMFECTHSKLRVLPRIPDTIQSIRVSHNN